MPVRLILLYFTTYNKSLLNQDDSMTRMTRIFSAIGSAITLLLPACSLSKHPAQAAGTVQAPVTKKQTSLTLVLKAAWNPDSSVHFSVYNDIRNEGLFRHKSRPAGKNSGFLLHFTDASGTYRDSAYIDHPLREYVETRTGQGKLLKELFVREEAYTEVSVLYTTDMKKLVLTDLLTHKQQSLDIR